MKLIEEIKRTAFPKEKKKIVNEKVGQASGVDWYVGRNGRKARGWRDIDNECFQ
ncbi:hypothetical protein ACFL57_01955 [Candidatus Margulisiibacteriota bacterium]